MSKLITRVAILAALTALSQDAADVAAGRTNPGADRDRGTSQCAAYDMIRKEMKSIGDTCTVEEAVAAVENAKSKGLGGKEPESRQARLEAANSLIAAIRKLGGPDAPPVAAQPTPHAPPVADRSPTPHAPEPHPETPARPETFRGPSRSRDHS